MQLRKASKKISKQEKIEQEEALMKLKDRKKRKPIQYIENQYKNSVEQNAEGVYLKYGVYSREQQELFFAIRSTLLSKTTEELKDMLRKNNQLLRGDHNDLLDRVADGILQGQTDRCGTCYRGGLQYNLSDGTYQCRGFYNGHYFRQCGVIYEKGDYVGRLEWIT